jgi:hypothetical protein
MVQHIAAPPCRTYMLEAKALRRCPVTNAVRQMPRLVEAEVGKPGGDITRLMVVHVALPVLTQHCPRKDDSTAGVRGQVAEDRALVLHRDVLAYLEAQDPLGPCGKDGIRTGASQQL